LLGWLDVLPRRLADCGSLAAGLFGPGESR